MSTQDSEPQSPLHLHIPKMENKIAQLKPFEPPALVCFVGDPLPDTKLQGSHSKWVPKPVGAGGKPSDSGFPVLRSKTCSIKSNCTGILGIV